MGLVRSLALETRKQDSRIFEDHGFRRLQYVRYADDWIVGVRGTFSDAQNLLSKITAFCEGIGLKISPDKTKITNLLRDKALFLGVELSRSNVMKFTKIPRTSQTKRLGLRLRMTAPLNRVIKKLTEAGFIKNQQSAPKFLWLARSHDQIIHLYNSVFRGYINYYSFVHNYGKLVCLLTFILKQSAAKLLAAKFKLKTRAKVFKKFGNGLTSPNKISFLKTSYRTNPYLAPRFKVKNPNQNPEMIQSLFASYKSLASLMNLICTSCGSDHRVEMHHVRKMSDLNPKVSAIDRLMVHANRKQIPLCRVCHMKLHNSISKTKLSS